MFSRRFALLFLPVFAAAGSSAQQMPAVYTKLLSACDYHAPYWSPDAARTPPELISVWLQQSAPGQRGGLHLLGLAVHESYHYETVLLNALHTEKNLRQLYGDSSLVSIDTKTLPSSRSLAAAFDLQRFKPEQLTRFGTYVSSSDSTHVTQQFGVAGLIEEFLAYRQAYAAGICMFTVFNDTLRNDRKAAAGYLSTLSSDRIACREMLLYVYNYLHLLRSSSPADQAAIMSNKTLWRNLALAQEAIAEADSAYLQIRQTLAPPDNPVKPAEEKKKKKRRKEQVIIQTQETFDSLYAQLKEELALEKYKEFRDLMQAR